MGGRVKSASRIKITLSRPPRGRLALARRPSISGIRVVDKGSSSSPISLPQGFPNDGVYNHSSRCLGTAARLGLEGPVQFMSIPDDDQRMFIFLVVLASLLVLGS